MNGNRTARVSEELKRVISDIIKNSIRDPRLPEMFSVVSVEVTSDFSYAKVYYSYLSDRCGEKDVRDALKSAAGFIRRELGSRIRLRQVPELRFELDKSIERGIALNKLIDEVSRNDARKGK